MNSTISQRNYDFRTHNRVSFTAIPLAKYTPLEENSITIYKLEKRDLPFITKFVKNIDKYFKNKNINGYSTKQVMNESFKIAKDILSNDTKSFEKSEILLGVSDSKPCAILIGNVLKKGANNTLLYSSRKNALKKETELDWLTTWNPFSNKHPYKAGKIITTEYFNTLNKHKFENVYVRSEIPELSFAQEFYKKMGFNNCSTNRELISDAPNKYILKGYDNSNDKIIPMLAKNSTINKIRENFSKILNREKLDNISVNIEDVIK